MKDTAYHPLEGSIAARSIAHLATLPDGTWLHTRDLAAAINAPTSSMTPSLQAAVDHGALLTRQEGGRFLEWALPAARDAFDADERRGGKPVQRIVSAKAAPPAGTPGPSSVFEVGGAAPPSGGFKGWLARKGEASAEGRPTRKPRAVTPVLATAPPPLATPSVVCAVFNSGELLIEAPGQQPLRLAPEQTRDLLRWLRTFQPVDLEATA
jgi:hypothetical protein